MSSSWPIHGLIGFAVVVAFAILEFAIAPTSGRVAAQSKQTKASSANTQKAVTAPKTSSSNEGNVKEPTREKERTPRTRPKAADRLAKEVAASQMREAVQRPKFLGGCQAPPVSEALRESEETVRVRVRLMISEDGVPTQAKMERSHPMIPDESVIRCVLAQRFEPARLPDGTAVPYPYRRQFKFFAVPHLKTPSKNAGKAWKRRSSAAF